MAIIDSKQSAEAERQAREYAERNDTAGAVAATVHDWQQPPPAYEEASGSSTLPARPPESPSSTTEVHRERHPRRGPRYGSRHDADVDSESVDEATPLLLTRRQKQLLKKKLRAWRAVRKSFHFIAASLLLACVSLLLLQLFGFLNEDEGRMPDPPEEDGHSIEDPTWSSPVRTDPDLWPTPYLPLYTSNANFSLSAFNDLFLHARDRGGSYSGQVTVAVVDDVPDEEWKRMNKGTFADRVFIQVESRFTEISLRNSIRVQKMQMRSGKEGVGIYGMSNNHRSGGSFISFHVTVLLPLPHQRTHSGLGKDGQASYISELDIGLDNMRLTIEALRYHSLTNRAGNGGILFGSFRTAQLNGGLEMVNSLEANDSVSVSLQNGQARDLYFFAMPTIRAPKIHINIANGPLWLNKLVARDEIILKTSSGGLNITDTAIAPVITVDHGLGMIGGTYRAEQLDISSSWGELSVTVDLRKDIFEGEEAWSLPSLGTRKDNPEDDSYLNLPKCLQRRVNIRCKLDDVNVVYINQDSNIQLFSNVSTSTSGVKVTHSLNYEGSFLGKTQIGGLRFSGPNDSKPLRNKTHEEQQRKKKMLFTLDNKGPLNKSVKGIIWWSDHTWDEVCQSDSRVSSEAGTVNIQL